MALFDTNVLVIASLGPEEDFQAATIETLMQIKEVAVPALWAYEYNAVATYTHRRRDEFHITKEEAREGFRIAHDLVSETLHHKDRYAVLQLALHYNCSGYDAEFIYWAIELGTPLITNDLKLCGTVPAHTLPLRDYLDAPSNL